MKKLSWLITLGVGAYLVFALVTLPASLVIGALEQQGIQASGVDGTVWRGRAQVVQLGSTPLGRLEWDLHALALLSLRLQADVKLTRSDGFAQGRVSVQGTQRVELEDLTASLPISALRGVLSQSVPSGTINLKFPFLVLENGWPVEADGTAELLNITSNWLPPTRTMGYRVVFPHPQEQPPEGSIVGAVTDLEGPIQLAGTLRLGADRSYELVGQIAAKADAPSGLQQQLELLPEDERGRRKLIEGTM